MSAPNLAALGRASGTPFGKVFVKYSEAFGDRNFPELVAAFAPGAKVTVRDRRGDESIVLSPGQFFEHLYEEVGETDRQFSALWARTKPVSHSFQ